MKCVSTAIVLFLQAARMLAQEPTRPLTPEEALKRVDQKVTVAMEVKSTGGNTARYLNSEADFRTDKNFAVFIPNVALAAFKQAGIEDPGVYYKGKTIVVVGTVVLSQNRPQLRVENVNQIRVLNAKPQAAKRPAASK